MSSSVKAYLAALVYTFIIGLSFMFVKIALNTASPLDILADRFTIAFLAGSAIFILNRDKLRMNTGDFFAILPLAMLYPILFFSLQAFGLAYTSSAEAGIIQACIPILTLILASYFLKERSGKLQRLFTFLSVIGVIYIFAMSGAASKYTNTLGIILIFLSALSSSCYSVLARNLTQKYSAAILTYFMTGFGMIIFNGASIIRHIAENTLCSYFRPFADADFFASVVYLGILSSLGSSFLSNYALSKIEASQISVFTNLATLITIAAGVIFLKEQLHYFHIIGAVFILSGVIGTNYFSGKK